MSRTVSAIARGSWPGLLVAVVSALALALALLPGSAGAQETWREDPCEEAPRAAFPDRGQVSTAHRESVDCAAHLGIFLGTAAGVFAPAQPLTRGQAASVVSRALDVAGYELPDGEGDDLFTDIAASAHRIAINALGEDGIVVGFGDGTFGPRRTLTRAQMATLLLGAVEWAYDVDFWDFESDVAYFSDVTEANVHFGTVGGGYELGLFVGVEEPEFDDDSEMIGDDPEIIEQGLFAPGEVVNRQQMASFVVNLLYAVADLRPELAEAGQYEGYVIGILPEETEVWLLVDDGIGGDFLAFDYGTPANATNSYIIDDDVLDEAAFGAAVEALLDEWEVDLLGDFEYDPADDATSTFAVTTDG
jgi:hypothetical protein